MKRYKLVYEVEGCIGAGPCAAVSPKQWTLDEQRKAHAKNAEVQNGKETKEFDEDELEEHMNAAVSCPVNVIHIFDQKTGKQLA